MTLEETATLALQHAGNTGRYQKILIVLLCVIFYFDVFLLMGPSFYFMDPTFKCEGSDQTFDEKEACPRIDQCQIINDFTITKHMGLYCDRQGSRDAIQAMLSVGSLLGLILMNVVSDLRGRRLALLVDLILATLSTILTIVGAYAQSVPLLIIGSTLGGFSGYSMVIVSYIIAGDVCEEQMRQKSSLWMNLSYSLGLITFFFMYNWINQWYNIVFLFMLFPMIGLTLVSCILVQQSPNYHLCKRRDKKSCINVLTNIACYNNRTEEDIQKIQNIVMEADVSQAPGHEQQKSVLEVLKQWQYLKIIIFVAITEAGSNLFFYGIEYAIDDIGFNYGADNLVLGSTEIVATLVLTRFVSSLNRRKTMTIAYLFTVLVSLIYLFEFVQKSNTLSTLLIVCIRASTTTGYFMIVMMQTESFPLEIQSIGAGTIEAFSQLGSVAAPLVIAFAINIGWEKMATMGVILLVCLIPLKFVPEPASHAKKDDLQETLLQSQIQ